MNTNSEVTAVLKKYTREYSAGEVIYKEKDIAKFFVFLLNGIVHMTVHVPGDGDLTLSILMTGAVFGASEVFEEGRYHSTAIAITKTQAIILDKSMVELVWEKYPGLMRRIARLNSELTSRLVARLVEAQVRAREEVDVFAKETAETHLRLEEANRKIGKETAQAAIAELLLDLDEHFRDTSARGEG